MKDLTDLRKIAEEATPGEWVYGDNRDGLGNKLHPAKFPGKYNPIADFEYTEDHDAEFIATFDPPTVLTLLNRIADLEAKLSRAKNVAGVMASRNVELTACNREAQDRLEQAEAAVARVREVATGDPTEYGWFEAMFAVLRALDGESNE